ncbi:MAG: hypothetical protein JJU36_16000 [Phycisphaeraceae bacterium]|nr:hypothetical protein [Phycisphaeraceae bacterium]
MYQINRTATRNDRRMNGLDALLVHKYEYIARMLLEQDGISLSATEVGRVCRSAEEKICRGILADPVLRRRLLADSTEVDGAASEKAPGQLSGRNGAAGRRPGRGSV